MRAAFARRAVEGMGVEDYAKEPAAGIARRIKGAGPVTFAEYMGLALYGPGGYYTSGEREPWGGQGDYITSLDVSPVFSTLLARQLLEMWELMGSPASFHLIEAGAGRGTLGKSILRAVRRACPEFSEALKVTLVEKNLNLHEAAADGLCWREDITGLETAQAGCVLSNELIDSFPVHRVVVSGGVLKEIFVGLDAAGAFAEIEGPVSTPELPQYLESGGVTLAEGQKAEINLEAGRWLASAASLLDQGFFITIDYGLPARELYSPDRMEGTLLCHYRHTLNDNPYINIGTQDMTAHVDFSAFASLGRSLGLGLTGFATQKNFLLGLGICDELAEAEGYGAGEYEKVKSNRELARLIAPGGMGDTFKVLVQHKGMEKPALKGFSFRDQSRFL